MKHTLKNYFSTGQHLLALTLLASLASPVTVQAASVALATSPLATSTTSSVKPNIMFILDDSGSMDWDYLPDWADDNNPFTGSSYRNNPALHKNNGFNGVAYNPAVTYLKPVFYNTTGTLNTTTYPDMVSPWTLVKNDGYGVQSTTTTSLVGNASHYVFTSAEYCTSNKMTSCVPSTAPITIAGIYYGTPAKVRWCNSPKLTSCQNINNATYNWPRYPGQQFPSSATLTVTGGGTATSIKVNGFEILSGTTNSSTTKSTVASRIATNINNCTAAKVNNCTVAGYSASASGDVVTILAPLASGAITFTPVALGTMSKTITAFSGSGTVPGSNLYTNIVSTTNSYAYPGTTSKASTRSDCAGTTCTYAEEMNNYANWWAYYHTRMQAMKTAVSRSFTALNNNYRVGFSTISNEGGTDGTTFLGNNTFEKTHKNSWYKKLFAGDPSSSTPLRAALSKAGRYYARKLTGQVDPVQYSCQQNFTMLSTDGYWNTNDESSTYGPFGVAGAKVGNMDSLEKDTKLPWREGDVASDTLADVAMYYYNTDLRNKDLWSNCAGGISPDYPSGNPNVCDNDVFTSSSDNQEQQHMTTFTMGLGIDGTLTYDTDYATAKSGDYYDLANNNTLKWLDPINNTQGERIDDLWHAAVNGRGTYFSAKNPNDIIDGFSRALSAISAKIGSAAAAATSTLNPVAGDNFAYVASYTTVSWKGNLESREIAISGTDAGTVSKTALWCVENVTSTPCTATLPAVATIDTETVNGATVTSCIVTNANVDDCPPGGVFDSASSTCTALIASSCTGTLPKLVKEFSDDRKIYTANSGSAALVEFDSAFANSASNATHFNTTRQQSLTQWPDLTATEKLAATSDNLVGYLRGQFGYEIRSSNIDRKLYRAREAVMGDALESQPAYVSKPVFSYSYPGYTAYKDANKNRLGTVFMGTNDGMLHAFDALGTSAGGKERWAYVPSFSVPNMWQLADKAYSTNHRNFVNGSPTLSDICTASCTSEASAVWKTILVGGLNAGGRGYYALDITIPDAPALLWEFGATSGTYTDPDLGYSYSKPIVTRRTDGKWVVLVTSGYNNTSPGNGVGYLYVLDASNGNVLSKISTGAGDTTTPSGLGRITVWNEEAAGNKAGMVYGGDLEGNLWRFDINNVSVSKLATLLGPSGKKQPITTTPALGIIDSNRAIFVGTGKYLEKFDLDPAALPLTKEVQSLYAIKDNGLGATLSNVRTSLVQQSLAMNIDGTATRVPASTNGCSVDFTKENGWFVDFPDVSTEGSTERVNVDPLLIQGILIVPTIVPSNTVCSPGGYGWLNFFDYKTGCGESEKANSTIVGINVLYIDGNPKVSVVTSDDPTPKVAENQPPFTSATGKFKGVRSMWREMFQ